MEGDKQDSFFYKKDKNRMAKMELIIIIKRRRFQSIYLEEYILESKWGIFKQ